MDIQQDKIDTLKNQLLYSMDMTKTEKDLQDWCHDSPDVRNSWLINYCKFTEEGLEAMLTDGGGDNQITGIYITMKVRLV